MRTTPKFDHFLEAIMFGTFVSGLCMFFWGSVFYATGEYEAVVRSAQWFFIDVCLFISAITIYELK